MVHQRVQWPSLDAKYITSYIGYDRYYAKQKSGLGFYLMHDIQGSDHVSSTQFQVQYSYEVYLTRDIVFVPALQAGVSSISVDYSKLLFPSQVSENGILNSDNGLNKEYRYNADVSTGFLTYGKKWWVGYSAHHLNKPNQTFLDGESYLPVKHTLIAGYKIDLIQDNGGNFTGHIKEYSIYPVMNYKHQGESDQLDLGAYVRLDHLLAAMWYRGIPVKKYKTDLQNSESVVALLGWQYKKISFTYSYDFVVSRLTQAGPNGAHELNITYTNDRFFNNKKVMKRTPCPKFL